MQTLTIDNKSGKIRLNEVVTKPAIDRLIDEIGKLFGASAHASGQEFGEITACVENGIDTLEIELNSPGGSVFDGYTIYSEIKSLRERGVEVTATITGMAASMASVIAMACNTIRMVPHGRMMIHDASNTVGGNAEALREAADLLDSISDDIAGIYSERTGKPTDEVRAMMKKTTWMSSKEALAAGFIDEIFDIQTKTPKPTGMNLIDRLTKPSNEESVERINALETQIANHDSEIEDFKAKLETAEAALQEAAGFKAEIVDLSAKLATADELATIQATAITALEETIAAKETEVAEAKESAGKLATETLASIGQPEPLATEGESAPVNHLETFAKLTGAERTAYYAANEAAIKAELSK